MYHKTPKAPTPLDPLSQTEALAKMKEPVSPVSSSRPRRVVCAAIRANNGSIVLGIRHYSVDMHNQLQQRVDAVQFRRLLDENQGFVDQWGVFMTREEAYQVAKAAGQILYPEACGQGLNGPKLYSEGLY